MSLIQTLSKHTRTDLPYLFKGAFWSVAGQAIAAFSAFVLSVIFAHFASKETFGTYRYILSVANLLTAFSLSGLNTSIIQAVARGYHGAFVTSFRTSLLWSTPGILASFGVGLYYWLQGNHVLGLGIPIAGLLVNLWNALLLFRSFANGKKLFFQLFLANSALSLLPLGALFLTFSKTNHPVSLLLVFLSTACLVSALAHTIIRHLYVENTAEDPDHHRYTKHLSSIYILDTFASYLDKVLVFQTIGGAELALYTFATALPEQVRALTKSVQSIILPKFSVRPLPEIMKELPRKMALSTVGLLVVAVCYILIAPHLFRLFFPQYTEAIRLSQLFACILVFENGLTGIILKAKRAIQDQYVLNIVGNVSKILLMVVLLRLYGLPGIIIARIVARAGSFITSYILTQNFARKMANA